MAGSAFAQGPQRTTATYQDWMVRYEMGGHAKVCDMTQSTQLKAHSEPITQIAIGRQGRSGLLRIVFQVPINVWLPAGVKLTTAVAQVDVTAGFNRCIPAGCFADADINEGVIKKLSGMATNGKLQFKDAGQHDVAIPVSFKGFGGAYEALQK